MGEPELPLGLAAVISTEEGRRLLVAATDRITPQTVAGLQAAALANAADREAVADLTDWARHARALHVWDVLLTEPPTDLDDARRRITDAGPDDRFFDIGLDVLRAALSVIGDEAAQAAVNVRTWVLRIAAQITGEPAHVARSAFADGLVLMWPQVAADRDGQGRDEVSLAAAGAHFARCCDVDKAPLSLRVESLANLAWIAGPDAGDEVAAYQERSEQLLASAPDRDLDAIRTVRRDRAWWAAEAGDDTEALRLHEANLADTEHDLHAAKTYNYATIVVRNSGPDYVGAITASLRLADGPRIVEVAEDGKARAFMHDLSLLGVGPVTSEFLAARAQRIATEAAELDRRITRSPSELAAPMRHRLDELIEAYGHTQQRMAGRPLGWHVGLWRRRSVDDIRRLVPPGGAYVSYHWSPTRVVIGVIGEDGLVAPPTEVTVPADELGDDRVGRAAFNLALTIRMRGDFTSADMLQRSFDQRMEMFWPDKFQRYLYDQLIAPVANQLLRYGTLVISPHARLRGVPFHALRSPEGRVLVEDHPIVYVDGARMLDACRGRRRTSLGRCFVCGTEAGAGGPAAAAEEAAVLARLFDTTPSPATRAAVLQDATKADVVHLACHADYRTSLSQSSGLALDDGTLTTGEVRGSRFAASLVTLSACMTATTDVDPLVTAEEMNGLVGAFIHAGVPTVAATLWPLPDRVAVTFATTFYSALLGGTTAAEAMQRAQLAVKADFPHPYHWAPFTLWGDATARFTTRDEEA